MEVDKSRWTVHKFGGTSVGNADCMRKCIDIIRPITDVQRVAVVVSAMGGKPKVTDLLLDLVHAAAGCRRDEITTKVQAIKDKHKACVDDILANVPEIGKAILARIHSDLQDISDLLRAVELMRNAHDQILELVSGYGELWSANIMAEAMNAQGLPFVFVNARDVLLVSEVETIGTKVHWEESEAKLYAYLSNKAADFATSDFGKTFANGTNDIALPHLMITGYIASTLDGVATTLKRDGSDFSASIFGKMLRATTITIWTDVSGVYSADPRRVPEALILPDVSYAEAVELAYFGAKVIHPKTMAPAIMDKIPIYIRNTFEPSHRGTRIFLPPDRTEQKMFTKEQTVCGFTTVDDVALVNIEGSGMIGVPGIAHRLFGALKASNIPVMFVAQASSEHNICFATKSPFADKAREAIEQDFFYELKQHLLTDVRVIKDCSIIAAVGESMKYMPGVSGIFFGALGEAAVNILSISQGCDERNIAAVVRSKDATRALRAVHSAFWLSKMDISIGIIGTGRVGSAVLQNLFEQIEVLERRFGLSLKVRGIINSRSMILGENLLLSMRGKMTSINSLLTTQRKSHSNVSLTDLEAAMNAYTAELNEARSNASSSTTDQAAAEGDMSGATYPGDRKYTANLMDFLEHVTDRSAAPHTIIVDASTSHDVAALHETFLRHGAHIVTANKRGLSSTLDRYNAIFEQVRANHRSYMSEVTIGASLPIRTTLQDILYSGDAVNAIVGHMSVSVGFMLTDICDLGLSFTEALVKTYKKGLFEDDAFLDLEGTEVAEKLLIFGRELGFPMTASDIDIEPLATRRQIDSWLEPGDSFRAEDIVIAERARQAKERGCTLRYIQRIECSPAAELGSTNLSLRASCKLEEVKLDSNNALVKGAVYHFSFHTARYAQTPLIVQGPLSDSANTASGIVGDILRVARSVGATDRGPEALTLRDPPTHHHAPRVMKLG